MKFLFDLFPAIVFFASFKYAERNQEMAAAWVGQFLGAVPPEQAPILLATFTVIVATVLQILWTALRHGKVSKMLWVSLALITLFGSMTLIFHNETFIKWKPTVLYWVMATSMLAATFFKKNAIQLMLKNQVSLPEPVWFRLNFAWILFLTALGIINLFVAYHYPTPTWVNFKLFGTTALMILFIVAQGVYLSRHIQEDKS